MADANWVTFFGIRHGDAGRAHLETGRAGEHRDDLPAPHERRRLDVTGVPSLTKRSASGTVELADGQTIGLAGLINDNMRSMVSKFPGLGSLPVIGSLFRSQDFVKGQTELVILVTPRLARPIDPSRLRLPTDGYREPSDTDFFLRGRLQAPAPKTPATPRTAPTEEKNP